ncbi:DUF4129 domain-containing protein [Nocardioides sp.]|uniref:DUF4129 domain-containing protein n=1 Tax=Nocardioides sp. TaxID=35761 RepID=UPI0027231CD3|nr:DUF4129 domain-containing protein [Nocardioides sp.]MDO9456822.1 DUF4129 domain-containing protein [Nocardioides sp.]
MRLEPPLDPSGDDARGLLRRELADPTYFQDNLVQRIIDWIGRQVDGSVEGARGIPSLTWFAITLIVLALVGGLAFLASRARGTARRDQGRGGDVLTDEVVTAAELRRRAEVALAEGRHADAVVDGFRALARRQVERGRLEDSPGVTAHEVAAALAGEYPQHRDRTAAGADLFDAVMYGERPATRDQAVAVLDLDVELAGAR